MSARWVASGLGCVGIALLVVFVLQGSPATSEERAGAAAAGGAGGVAVEPAPRAREARAPMLRVVADAGAGRRSGVAVEPAGAASTGAAALGAADGSRPAPAAGQAVAPGAGERQASARSVERVLRRMTPMELSLYRELERARKAPPREAEELLAHYRAGASRAELEAFVRKRFPRDAKLRLAAVTWIAEARPAAGAAGAAASKPAPGGDRGAPLGRPGQLQRVSQP
jgi:hypothetical protein